MLNLIKFFIEVINVELSTSCIQHSFAVTILFNKTKQNRSGGKFAAKIKK